jgi:type I restriction enzyme, S subunit
VQKSIVEKLDRDWRLWQERLAKARELLMIGDREIAKRLGLRPPDRVNPQAWAVRRDALIQGRRLNAEFFHPERLLTVRTITEARTPSRRVDSAVAFIHDPVDAPAPRDFYVGLAHVERDTGELAQAQEDEDDRPSGAVLRFQSGDVLFAKLRPYLNKVHLAERGGVCSPEFFVLRPNEDVRGEYLAAILRSEITLAQTRHMAGGNTHPRLTPADVHAMFIPMPNRKLQDKIADCATASREQARAIKINAEQDWSDAKQHFGDDLFR